MFPSALFNDWAGGVKWKGWVQGWLHILGKADEDLEVAAPCP
jgi:hypothetical protein